MNKSIYENLSEARNNLVKEISLLSYDEFNRRLDMENWSIAQVCHHLFLVEKASTNAVAFGLKEINSSKKEPKQVQLLLDRTRKVKAPKIVEPKADPLEVSQIIDLLNVSRKKLLTLLSTVEDKAILAEKAVKHPFFGDELTLDQWVESIYLHEQRHIEQIKEIKLLINAE